MSHPTNSPHKGQQVLVTGAPLDKAKAAMVMLHGRGASAEDIFSLVPELAQPEFAYLAPQAADFTWYPNRFFVPLEANEPWLSSALAIVGDLLAHVAEEGIPPERVILLGFSQGACLALEFAARNTRRYGGLAALSGALIGPENATRQDTGSLDSTPVFLGCSDVDFHIPAGYVQRSAAVLKQLGGDVTMKLYPGMGHTINEDELKAVREMMTALV